MAMNAQRQIRENTQEIHDYLKDLKEWEHAVKEKDSKLRTSHSQDKKLPPVRKKVETNDQTKLSAAKHTYDYFRDKWDKFDVDAALQEVDEEQPGKSNGDVAKNKKLSGYEAIPSILGQSKSLPDAASEKDLGNQYFKDKKYVQAIECYSRSIALQPTAVAYANRAMALLKIRRYEDAEIDCTEAIALDDRYTKAYARRGTARKERKKLMQSIEDFEFGLRLEPQNKELQKQYQEAKELYEKEMDVKPVEKKVPVKIKELDTSTIKSPAAASIIRSSSAESSATSSLQSTTSSSVQIAAARAAAKVTHNVVVPKTSYEFETLWRGFSEDRTAKARLLKMMDPLSFPTLFKDSLGAPLMLDIIRTLELVFPDDGSLAVKILDNLTKVGRFSMTLMFLTQKDKKTLRQLWDEVFTCGEHKTMEDLELLQDLRAKFKLA